MPVLHIEEVPSDLYDRLQERAVAHNRALRDEVILLLREALSRGEEARAAHSAALAELRRSRWTPPAGTPESMELLHEDRER